MPRAAGGQRARLPWSGAGGIVSEGQRGLQGALRARVLCCQWREAFLSRA